VAGLVFTPGPWETNPGGIPDDLLDADGFPRVLHAARRVVQARGGRVDGRSLEWDVVPPRPELPALHVRFVTGNHDAGDVAIRVVGATHWIPVDVAQAYRAEPGRRSSDPDLTWTDSAVIGVLDGGYSEFVELNEHGEWVERGWHLRAPLGADGNRQFNVDLSPDRRTVVRRERREFPAWPARPS